MKIVVLCETAEAENRVAATPETVKKLMALGADVAVEAGAGMGANISDADYTAAGATVADRATVIGGAAMVLGVQVPAADALPGIAAGTMVAGMMSPFSSAERIKSYADAGLMALSMEFMPRITRAQSMDVLSSQSNLSGYKAVIDAAEAYGRAFPMMMTAAGTISAARAFIMGVGVAGLQAIATARRLGALVSATDVRSATKEQIESLGAKAIFVTDVKGIEGEGSGGYATEMSEEYKAAQAALVSSHIAKQDIVITTALIPGRPAPRLVTDEQLRSMRPGSVLVDLAVESGGNIEHSRPGEVVKVHGVTIIGHKNIAARMAADASALYSRNLYNFINAFWDKDAKTLTLPADDEIVVGVKLTEGGAVVHERLKAA